MVNIPPTVANILNTLNNKGYPAYLVGGCVRDLLLGKKPKDWDITTQAQPDIIQQLFPDHFYENNYGTVAIKTDSPDPSLKIIEVTPFRVEGAYSDARHPDEVKFVNSLEQDLARRDFTINAMAMSVSGELSDPYQGQQDLKQKTIRAVGNPADRLAEDALRMLRAIRLASELNFQIDTTLADTIRQQATSIKQVSQERIGMEVIRLVMSPQPETGLQTLASTGLLAIILPELAEGLAVEQNRHHIFSVFEHSIKALQYAAEQDYSLAVRLAALFHDCGKPRTRGEKEGTSTFYGHEVVSQKMAQTAMQRLCFPKEIIKRTTHLIRQHMFYYDIDKVTEAGARRLLRRVGEENWDDLIKLRKADRMGSGVPKAEPYRLRHLQFLVEKAKQDPISTKQLAINGHTLISELGLAPGPIIGGILNALLAEVLTEPTKNKKAFLLQKATELKLKNIQDLKKLGLEAIEAAEQIREQEIKEKYHV